MIDLDGDIESNLQLVVWPLARSTRGEAVICRVPIVHPYSLRGACPSHLVASGRGVIDVRWMALRLAALASAATRREVLGEDACCLPLTVECAARMNLIVVSLLTSLRSLPPGSTACLGARDPVLNA